MTSNYQLTYMRFGRNLNSNLRGLEVCYHCVTVTPSVVINSIQISIAVNHNKVNHVEFPVFKSRVSSNSLYEKITDYLIIS